MHSSQLWIAADCWVTKLIPWSVACFNASNASCGLFLLSKSRERQLGATQYASPGIQQVDRILVLPDPPLTDVGERIR